MSSIPVVHFAQPQPANSHPPALCIPSPDQTCETGFTGSTGSTEWCDEPILCIPSLDQKCETGFTGWTGSTGWCDEPILCIPSLPSPVQSCARDACDHQLVVPAFSRHPVRPQLQLGAREAHAITNSPAGLQPASCQAPASAGAPRDACDHRLSCRPSAGILSGPNFSWGAKRCMRSPTLLPAFSRHPVRPQLQLGLSEAAHKASPLQRASPAAFRHRAGLDCLKALYISLAEAN